MARARTDAKRRTILEAASRVFSERDFHEVPMDEVAVRAGVGKGTVYRYFETKDDLYCATLLCGFAELLETLIRVPPKEMSPARRLEKIAAETLRVFWNRRSFYRLMHRDERRFRTQDRQLRRQREKVVRLVQETIVEGIARGDFRGVDPRVGAELFMGMVRGSLFYLRDADTLPSLARQIVQVFLEGVAKGDRG